MSAFIVNRRTIALLTEAMQKYGITSPRLHPDAIGMRLWMENFRSVDARYDEHTAVPPYIHAGTSAALLNDPYTVYKVARCYKYQSCETDDYEDSWAGRMIGVLLHAIETELDMTDNEITQTQAYEDAPWGL